MIDQNYLISRFESLLQKDKENSLQGKVSRFQKPEHHFNTEEEWRDAIFETSFKSRYKWSYLENPEDILLCHCLSNTEKLFELLKVDIENQKMKDQPQEIHDVLLEVSLVIDHFQSLCRVFGKLNLSITVYYDNFINQKTENTIREIAFQIIKYLAAKINPIYEGIKND